MSSQITVYNSTRIFVRNFRANTVAAVDWCSHTTLSWIWLVSCLGFNSPLGQNFSLYRTVSQRGRKKRKKIDERKMSQQPSSAHLLQTLPYHSKHHRTNRPTPSPPPPYDLTSTALSVSLSLSLSLSMKVISCWIHFSV